MSSTNALDNEGDRAKWNILASWIVEEYTLLQKLDIVRKEEKIDTLATVLSEQALVPSQKSPAHSFTSKHLTEERLAKVLL